MVYADWLLAGEDKPTILIYGHFDVQPVDPLTRGKVHRFNQKYERIVFLVVERLMTRAIC